MTGPASSRRRQFHPSLWFTLFWSFLVVKKYGLGFDSISLTIFKHYVKKETEVKEFEKKKEGLKMEIRVDRPGIVKINVADSAGVISITATFLADPAPPTPPPLLASIDTGLERTATVGVPLSFRGHASGGTPPYSYFWTFADGLHMQGQEVSRAFAATGDLLTVEFRVEDSLRGFSSAHCTVAVSPVPPPPPPPPPGPQSRLIDQSNFTYLGNFRLPDGVTQQNSFTYGGLPMAFNPRNKNLFIRGHDWYQRVAEVMVPLNLASNAVAQITQPFTDLISRIPNKGLDGVVKIGGLMVTDNGGITGSIYIYYDNAGPHYQSHFRLSSIILASATCTGLFKVGGLSIGYVGGYMAPIPQEWQAALGATHLTGMSHGLMIGLNMTSIGPAAFGFDPVNFGSAIPYVYYPKVVPANPTVYTGLGQFDSKNQYYNAISSIGGVVFVPGTKSILFVGVHNDGGIDYKHTDPNGWGMVGGHGFFHVWAYSVDDFLKVKAGLAKPWEIKPYAMWQLKSDLQAPRTSNSGCGVAYDYETNRLFLSQSFGDGDKPRIHVFQVR